MDGQRMDKPRSTYQLIGVHRRSSAAKLKCRANAKALENNSSAADKRRSTPIFGRNRGTRPVQLIPGRCPSLTFALRAGFRPGRIIFGLPATRFSEKGLKAG